MASIQKIRRIQQKREIFHDDIKSDVKKPSTEHNLLYFV